MMIGSETVWVRGDVILTGLPRPEHVSDAMGLREDGVHPDGALAVIEHRQSKIYIGFCAGQEMICDLFRYLKTLRYLKMI